MGTRYPRQDELFTIAMPADAMRDTLPRLHIDRMPSDSNAEGTWLGRDWRLDWWWWREVRVAGSRRRGEATMTTRWLSDPDSSLVVCRARWYHWRRQLLRVNFTQHEPSDSLAAERLLASVKFEPKPPWR